MSEDAAQLRPSFGVRVLALLLDYAIILGYMALIAVVTLTLRAITGEFFDWLSLGTAGAQLLGFVVLVLPVGIYLYLCEASSRQATVGKRALRLRVVDFRTGGRPPRGRVLVRTIVKLLPWEIAHFAIWNVVAFTATGRDDFPIWLLVTLVVADALPVIYVLVVLLQKDRRGPHDLVAGTRVVRVAEPRGTARS